MNQELEIELKLDNVEFRFKTKEELIEEFGGLNSDCLGFGWNPIGDMDYLFGTVIPSNWNVNFFKLIIGVIDHLHYPRRGGNEIDTWFIMKSVITYKLLGK